jgi:CHAT domain-containing protein
MRSEVDRPLPVISAELATQLDSNPLLETDKQLRMFCLVVKGDIDGEMNSGAMRHDWQQVQSLARELGDTKWQYRSLAQLGLVAFYEGDLATARKNVASALAAATAAGDAGAQIRYLTVLGIGLMRAKMYEQAFPYFDRALKISDATSDAGYPFVLNQSRTDALTGLGRFDEAKRLQADMLVHARALHQSAQEASALVLGAQIARAQHDDKTALSGIEQSIAVSKKGGLTRQIADEESLSAEIYRDEGNLTEAERHAALSAGVSQTSGNLWAVPEHLRALAQIETARGEYAKADRVYQRGEAFIDAAVANASAVLDKTALIRSASDLYSEHFALIAQHFQSPARASSTIEQVRGRIMTDLLMAGSVAPAQARMDERTISRFQLRLMNARSDAEVRSVRDQIFGAEQARWVTPEISILKARAQETVPIRMVQNAIGGSTIVLEYVVADPQSYCLVISQTGTRIIPMAGKTRIDALASDYLRSVKALKRAEDEGRQLYDVLVRPLPEVGQSESLVIVRDGPLNLVPFDALIGEDGQYMVERHTIIYAPSVTSFLLLSQRARHPHAFQRDLLALGGIPYGPAELIQIGATSTLGPDKVSSLAATEHEVRAAEAAVQGGRDTLLLGPEATESAFKRLPLRDYRLVHLAVHGFADNGRPERSALLLASDPSADEDGLLRASEVVQLHLDADLVVLSACDTAVGPIQGEEGIAALSRAFLLAGSKAVISTLWSVGDTSSLFLMKRFYAHLATEPAPYALAEAKRDIIRQYGHGAVPFTWAGFTFEGGADRVLSRGPKQGHPYVVASEATDRHSGTN